MIGYKGIKHENDPVITPSGHTFLLMMVNSVLHNIQVLHVTSGSHTGLNVGFSPSAEQQNHT